MSTRFPLGDLEKPEDIRFQKKWWVIQRTGWFLMICFLVAGVLGVFGQPQESLTAIGRGAGVYVFLLIVFRMAGKRTLDTLTTFDFILVLIISEAIQEAISPKDAPISATFIVVVTLVLLDILLSFMKHKFKTVDSVMDDLPLVIFVDGKPRKDRMNKERVDESDILCSARINHGIESLDQIKIAILERDGEISIIPKGKKGAEA